MHALVFFYTKLLAKEAFCLRSRICVEDSLVQEMVSVEGAIVAVVGVCKGVGCWCSQEEVYTC